jgi:DNA-binding XRE family transcriptional regulator
LDIVNLIHSHVQKNKDVSIIEEIEVKKVTTFGQRLKQLRKDNKLTQAELAARLQVTRDALAKWETDKASPHITTIQKVADFFNVSLDYLYKDAKR